MIELRPAPNDPEPKYPDRVQVVQRMLREADTVVRTAALAWRNGLAALLAGLLGFSLVKGRSDVGTLALPWRIVVGVQLLVALLVGARSALWLLRAAHGRPRRVAQSQIVSAHALQRREAADALAALDRGIIGVLTCAAFLVVAVAITWYGPAASGPKIQVSVEGEEICGSVVRTSGGRLTLKTDMGQRTADLAKATGFRAVNACGK